MMRLMLESKGYQVDEASNGWAAYQYVKEKCPDLILMDISMSNVDGITATELINQIETRFHIPVVFITAHSDRYKEKAIAVGGKEVIPKPIDFAVLNNIVSKYLN
jgi:CheY-like chemotaxis protein